MSKTLTFDIQGRDTTCMKEYGAIQNPCGVCDVADCKDFKIPEDVERAFEELVDSIELSEEEREQIERKQKERNDARERHFNTDVMPYRFPMLWIKDRHSGREHLYGTDTHDSLWIDEDGNIQYYNLQNGDGTGGVEAGYEFVDHSDEYGYGAVPHYYMDTKTVN